MLFGVDITEQPDTPFETAKSETAAEDAGTAPSPFPAAQPMPRKCPQADCGQLNPSDADRCVYCNRPMEDAQPGAALRARIRWPWNEETEVGERLLVGRDAPTPPNLAARLEREYSNVSRRHAELLVDQDSLWIVDLGSTNGTFVNETRLTPNQRLRLVNGARLRFAADLTALVFVRDERP